MSEFVHPLFCPSSFPSLRTLVMSITVIYYRHQEKRASSSSDIDIYKCIESNQWQRRDQSQCSPGDLCAASVTCC